MPHLSQDKQSWINSVIANFKSSSDDSYYPLVSLSQMAESLGIQVFEDDLTRISGSLSGFITYDDPATKTNPRIYIERSLSPERKRFTLAHEFGHHFLHEGMRLRLENLDYSSNDTQEESEANYFAASLLMPKELLLAKMAEGLGVSELADFFEVSLSAMRNRIKWIQTN